MLTIKYEKYFNAIQKLLVQIDVAVQIGSAGISRNK